MTIQLGILIQQTPQRTMSPRLVEGPTQCKLKERNMRENASDVLLGEHRRDTHTHSHASSGDREELTAVQVAGDGGMGDEEVVEVGVLLE